MFLLLKFDFHFFSPVGPGIFLFILWFKKFGCWSILINCSEVHKTKMGEAASTAHPKVHYEFGGPVGAGFMVLSLPFVVIGLCFLCG